MTTRHAEPVEAAVNDKPFLELFFESAEPQGTMEAMGRTQTSTAMREDGDVDYDEPRELGTATRSREDGEGERVSQTLGTETATKSHEGPDQDEERRVFLGAPIL